VQGASGEVVLTRAAGFADGTREARIKFNGKDPSPEELQRLSQPLVAGDRVDAPLQRWVGVSGAVERPGQYAFADALTLGGLVEQAGALRGARRGLLRRAGVDQEVDLDDVKSGQAPDVALQPGDEVIVKARRP
jgi:protein involved in polysaccharide export with SLBB domain